MHKIKIQDDDDTITTWKKLEEEEDAKTQKIDENDNDESQQARDLRKCKDEGTERKSDFSEWKWMVWMVKILEERN